MSFNSGSLYIYLFVRMGKTIALMIEGSHTIGKMNTKAGVEGNEFQGAHVNED